MKVLLSLIILTSTYHLRAEELNANQKAAVTTSALGAVLTAYGATQATKPIPKMGKAGNVEIRFITDPYIIEKLHGLDFAGYSDEEVFKARQQIIEGAKRKGLILKETLAMNAPALSSFRWEDEFRVQAMSENLHERWLRQQQLISALEFQKRILVVSVEPTASRRANYSLDVRPTILRSEVVFNKNPRQTAYLKSGLVGLAVGLIASYATEVRLDDVSNAALKDVRTGFDASN